MYHWKWKCMNCKKEYPENDPVPGDNMDTYIDPSGNISRKCKCGGIVGLGVSSSPNDITPGEELTSLFMCEPCGEVYPTLRDAALCCADVRELGSLKDCPFCGGSPTITDNSDNDDVIECTECNINFTTDGGFCDTDELIEAWNKRSKK